MIINVICILIAVISVAYTLMYRYQIRSIVKQIQFIRKHDTNKMVTKQLAGNEIDGLTKELNEVLGKYRELEIGRAHV